MEAHSLIDVGVEEVVTFRVPGVQSWVIGGGEGAVRGAVGSSAVEHEGTWKSGVLNPRHNSKVCKANVIIT